MLFNDGYEDARSDDERRAILTARLKHCQAARDAHAKDTSHRNAYAGAIEETKAALVALKG
jgi:hypothetical protein